MPADARSNVRNHRVAVIPGDGIGPELIDAALVVLAVVEERCGDFHLELEHHEGGAAVYERTGEVLSAETQDALRAADAIIKGPAGLPWVRRPDGTEAGSLSPFLRFGLDTYANIRPVQLLPGMRSPLKLSPGELDYVIVRENTEGLYLSRGHGIGTDIAMTDTLMVTQPGTERIVRYAFEVAQQRSGAPADGVRRVTCVDKSNVLATSAFFRRVFDEVGEKYPDIERHYQYADAAAQALVIRPQQFDVLVMENFLGDILSDLGGATVGGIGFCPSGNIGEHHAYFEPIHGSAPDLAGKDLANPISQVLTLAMMLEALGEHQGAGLVRQAVWAALEGRHLQVLEDGQPEGGTRAAAQTLAQMVAKLG